MGYRQGVGGEQDRASAGNRPPHHSTTITAAGLLGGHASAPVTTRPRARHPDAHRAPDVVEAGQHIRFPEDHP